MLVDIKVENVSSIDEAREVNPTVEIKYNIEACVIKSFQMEKKNLKTIETTTTKTFFVLKPPSFVVKNNLIT